MNKENHGALRIILAGFFMGMAEVVPGVSGGTVAFVAGVYQRLLNVINQLSSVPALLIKGAWKEILIALDWSFLWRLLSGMFIGIAVGVGGITFLLDNYPPLVWGLFFGLVVGSIIYMFKKISWSDKGTWLSIISGFLIAFFIGQIGVAQGSESLLFVFGCGAIAIVALVLPGISGSFILLLLGMYTFIVRDNLRGLVYEFSLDKVWVMIVFAFGCLAGLLSIARALKWAFEKYENRTIALLTGFMAGALPKLWPWRNTTLWMNKQTGEVTTTMPKEEFKILKEALVSPAEYVGDAWQIGVVVLVFIGVAAILLMDRFERSDKK